MSSSTVPTQDQSSSPALETHRSFLPEGRRGLTLGAAIGAGLLLVAWLLVAVSWDPLVYFDRGVAGTSHKLLSPHPTSAHGIELWSETFGTWSMRIVSLLVAVWLLLRRQFSTAVWAGGTVFCANLFGLIMKLAVERARPVFDDPIATGVGPSFPSGHSLMAVTGMGILLFATLPLLRGVSRSIAWAVAIGIAMSTALSRPLLGVHWFSDIVAGLSLGVFTVAGMLLVWTFLPQFARRWDRSLPRHG